MTTAFSEVLYKGPSINKASKALILLHGRGGTAKNIFSLSERVCNNDFYILAPQAVDHSWYPYSFLSEEKLNEPYLSQSVKDIKKLIDQTAEHVPKHCIYIMGFSQGACLALEVSARYASLYGGIIALTGGLIGSSVNAQKYSGNFDGTKILMSNGDNDPHIPLIRSEQSKKLLEKLGANVTLKVYNGRSHTICEDEIEWVKKELNSNISNSH